jgi:hypothetical protein
MSGREGSHFIARTGTDISREAAKRAGFSIWALTVESDPVHHFKWWFEGEAERDRFLKAYADGKIEKEPKA